MRIPSMHNLLRWPLFVLATVVVGALTGLYFLVRSLIIGAEQLTESGRVRKLRTKLNGAKSYQEYKETARELDDLTGVTGWKKNAESPFYNAALIARHTRQLEQAKLKQDTNEIINVLRECLTEANFGGVLNEALYSQCWEGTKFLVEDYVNMVIMTMYHLMSLTIVDDDTARTIKELVGLTTYGRTALCLSGGGTIAAQHLGVIDTLREMDICPDIITGTSGGSVVGAFFATRTAAEIQEDFNTGKILQMLCAFNRPWPQRMWSLLRTGAMFDPEEAYTKLGMWCKDPDMTFLEAFNKTGIVFNITMTTFQAHGDTGVLLNHLSAPNVVIRSAVLCSTAMPSFFNPMKLKEKTKTGAIVEREILRFSDGSLVTDIPKAKLGSLFNVHFFVVSQVNPHVTPFFFNSRGEAGNPLLWRWGATDAFRGGFILSGLEALVKEQIRAFVRVVRNLDLGPTVGGLPWVHVFLQSFHGDVTLTTTRSYWFKLFRALDNPETAEEVRWWVNEGRLMTWPKVSMIQARMRIEKALVDLGRLYSR